MSEFNLLLQKQMKKTLQDEKNCLEAHPQMKSLLMLVNQAYNDYEDDKKLLERSIDISSKEYIESIERTNQLQAQLIHNEKMAGIGQLSAGIAHEINNPLGFVLSNMEMLQKYYGRLQDFYDVAEKMIEQAKESDNSNSMETLEAFLKSNKIDYILSDFKSMMEENIEGLFRIEKIVKSLLGFSRTGSLNEFVEYDLNAGIKNTLTIAYNEIKYNASVTEELENIPTILALDGQINQVLLNIIVNASQAIKSKGAFGTIHIHTYADENYVYCEIADDGTGIPENIIHRIYEPFFTTKPVGTGTGIGLSIVYDIIVNKHHGFIEISSVPEEGTTFKIKLPIEQITEKAGY